MPTQVEEKEFVAPSNVAIAAHRTQLTVAEIVASRYDKLTGWLVAGMGAALTLMISNIDKTTTILSTNSVRTALKIFVGLLVLHMVQRVLALFVETAALVQEKMTKEDLSSLTGLSDLFTFLTILERPTFPPFSWVVARTFNQARRGVLMGGRIVQVVQAIILLAIAQVACAIWALTVIVRGLI